MRFLRMPRGNKLPFSTKCFCKSSLGLHVCLIRNSFTQTLFCTSKTFSSLYSFGSSLWSGEVNVFPSLLSLCSLFLREQCRTSGRMCVKSFTFFLSGILQKRHCSCCVSQAAFSTRKNTVGRVLRGLMTLSDSGAHIWVLVRRTRVLNSYGFIWISFLCC